MGLDLSTMLAGQWAFFHDTKTVTYHRKTTHGAFAAGVTVTAVARGPIDRADTARTPDLLARGGTVFHAWVAKLGVITPKIGDVISEGGVRYTIDQLRVCDEGQRYRCVVVKERP